MCTAAWLPSTRTGMPRACASFTTSLMGTTVPSTFDMCVIATMRVRLVSSFSNSSIRNVPSSAIGAHLRTAALALAVEMPGHDVGVVLHDRDDDLVALAEIHAVGAGDEVDALGGVAREDDLLHAWRIEEAARRLARVLVAGGGGVGEDSAARDGRWRIPSCRRSRWRRARSAASAPRRRCRDRPAACRTPRGRGSGSRCGWSRRRRRPRP